MTTTSGTQSSALTSTRYNRADRAQNKAIAKMKKKNRDQDAAIKKEKAEIKKLKAELKKLSELAAKLAKAASNDTTTTTTPAPVTPPVGEQSPVTTTPTESNKADQAWLSIEDKTARNEAMLTTLGGNLTTAEREFQEALATGDEGKIAVAQQKLTKAQSRLQAAMALVGMEDRTINAIIERLNQIGR